MLDRIRAAIPALPPAEQRVAKLVAAVFEREKDDLLVSGKLSQDNEGNEVSQRVAALLGRS